MLENDYKKLFPENIFPDDYDDMSIDEKVAIHKETGRWYGGPYRESKSRYFLRPKK